MLTQRKGGVSGISNIDLQSLLYEALVHDGIKKSFLYLIKAHCDCIKHVHFHHVKHHRLAISAHTKHNIVNTFNAATTQYSNACEEDYIFSIDRETKFCYYSVIQYVHFFQPLKISILVKRTECFAKVEKPNNVI